MIPKHVWTSTKTVGIECALGGAGAGGCAGQGCRSCHAMCGILVKVHANTANPSIMQMAEVNASNATTTHIDVA